MKLKAVSITRIANSSTIQSHTTFSFIFNVDTKFGNESIVEKVIRQDCSETDLRTGPALDIPKFVPMYQYERKDDTTFIAYCDHENCNTKHFIETSLKDSTQDKWIQGTVRPPL